MVTEAPNRKPHLLRVKREIVSSLDAKIGLMVLQLGSKDPGFEKEDKEIRRDLAIWIRQRNKIAKDADVAPMPLNQKDGQGNFIYKAE